MIRLLFVYIYTLAKSFSSLHAGYSCQNPPKQQLCKNSDDFLPTQKVLDQMPWLSVYEFRNKVKERARLDFQEHSKLLKQVEIYTERRLRMARQELKLKSMFQLLETKHHPFFERKDIPHPELTPKKFSISQIYSLMKYGDPWSLNYFAEKLAELILKDLPSLKANPSSWLLVVPSGYLDEANGAVKVSYLLGKALEKQLKVEFVPLCLTREQDTDYCALDDALARFDLAMQQYKKVNTFKKNVLIVDDAIVSGATIWAVMATLPKDAQTHTFCIVDAFTDQLSIEQSLNDSAINLNEEEILVRILNNKDAQPTIKALRTFLQWPLTDIKAKIKSLTLERRLLLVRTIQASPRVTDKIGKEKTHQVLKELLGE